jgi:predicted nucleic acid-binding protein
VIDRIVLDAGPLARACHPHARRGVNVPFNRWLQRQVDLGVEVCVSEITDYEVRRELVRIGARAQITQLDGFISRATFFELNRETMLLAAQLWAQSRATGRPTGAEGDIDCDVILAAQVRTLGGVVVTENVRHLSRFVDARLYEAVNPEDASG